MLTLNPGAVCDVCAEEYSPRCVPHSIPCGHVLCRSCCNTIIEKTPTRLTPVCPFCREAFASDTIRLIRIDFTASRWNTPRLRLGTLEAHTHDIPSTSDVPPSKQFPFVEPGFTRTRAEARRLEDKVAKVAAKKCSVEEVTTLHRELQDWLTSEDDQTSSLSLSAALLHAILVNHLAHSEASKQAKNIQASMKEKIDEMEMANSKLEAELRRQQAQYAQVSQECQALRAEVTRLKNRSTASSSAMPSSRSSGVTSPTHESRRQSVSSYVPRPPSVSPTPPPVYSPIAHSALSRFNANHHSRSISLSSTPSPGTRPQTTTPSIPQSQTPALRSKTPSIRSQTPSVRSHTPATPSRLPPLPQKIVSSPPPKIMRSSSEESQKETVLHERWIPSQSPNSEVPSHRTPSRFGFTRTTSASGYPMRYTTPANANSP